MRLTRARTGIVLLIATVTSVTGIAAQRLAADTPEHHHGRVHLVTVPEADKFTPFALTIHTGDIVTWVNNDTDNHTIVSDNPFDTAGHTGIDHLLLGTDANNGQPGMFSLRFRHAGSFVYYCRFHAHLDADSQPVAPGPDGGIQDSHGNFGTPMSGVITVLPRDDD
jgi:plastocyanin